MNYFDKAVFRANPRTNLDGTIQPIYMFSEVADGDAGNVQPYIRRDLPNKYAISTSEHDRERQSRRARFPAVLGDGWQPLQQRHHNNWHGIRGASLDNDDRPGGTEVWDSDGSQGVTFVDSHDDQSGQRPYLYKVAYAYTLMKPGNAVVYMNAKEFGRRPHLSIRHRRLVVLDEQRRWAATTAMTWRSWWKFATLTAAAISPSGG